MKKSYIKTLNTIEKQMIKANKKEDRLLNKKPKEFIKNKIEPIQQKIENKIPPKLQQTLEKAFEKGFKLIFKKGIGIIEKSYKKEDKNLSFDINHYAILKQTNHKNLKNLYKDARKSSLNNQFISTVEGSVLGFLGIGLPDIPILIGMILKTIYEVSLSYGFDYEKDEEKLYILYLICVSITKDEVQQAYNEKLELLSRGILDEADTKSSMEQAIQEASYHLAQSMLVAKFIQGLPIVGIVGGVSNWNMIKSISQMAEIKYKKRYLEGLLENKLRNKR